jgi:hypothetical protein
MNACWLAQPDKRQTASKNKQQTPNHFTPKPKPAINENQGKRLTTSSSVQTRFEILARREPEVG